MTRVSIASLDPMPALRQALMDRIDAGFNAEGARLSHVERAHAEKRRWAEANDVRLKPEADLRGISVADLSALILSKPDELAEREARRMQIKQRIRDATTPQELDAISP
jgi:hypothetical protein